MSLYLCIFDIRCRRLYNFCVQCCLFEYSGMLHILFCRFYRAGGAQISLVGKFLRIFRKKCIYFHQLSAFGLLYPYGLRRKGMLLRNLPDVRILQDNHWDCLKFRRLYGNWIFHHIFFLPVHFGSFRYSVRLRQFLLLFLVCCIRECRRSCP